MYTQRLLLLYATRPRSTLSRRCSQSGEPLTTAVRPPPPPPPPPRVQTHALLQLPVYSNTSVPASSRSSNAAPPTWPRPRGSQLPRKLLCERTHTATSSMLFSSCLFSATLRGKQAVLKPSSPHVQFSDSKAPLQPSHGRRHGRPHDGAARGAAAERSRRSLSRPPVAPRCAAPGACAALASQASGRGLLQCCLLPRLCQALASAAHPAPSVRSKSAASPWCASTAHFNGVPPKWSLALVSAPPCSSTDSTCVTAHG